ncbi:hypothetical protein C8Q74DRAFT_1315439 [Fomes fomentarius]|nr:hypothetical protein C8Q74DRAFT_1315439 [Fomes fomentarius]
MASTEQLTFYTAVVQLALDEANAKYQKHKFSNARSKPQWYYQISPLGRIPAITYGGPDSAKLVESLALLEFIAEIHPEAGLLPTDPVGRAKARAFISTYENYVHDAFRGVFFGKPADTILQAVEKLQNILPPTGFAVERFSIADIAVAPFLVRMMLFVKTGTGAYSDEDGQRMRDALASGKFARFRQYVQDLQERPCFQRNWDEALQIEIFQNHPKLGKGNATAAP